MSDEPARRVRGSADAGRGEPPHIEDEDLTVGEHFTAIRRQAGGPGYSGPEEWSDRDYDDDLYYDDGYGYD